MVSDPDMSRNDYETLIIESFSDLVGDEDKDQLAGCVKSLLNELDNERANPKELKKPDLSFLSVISAKHQCNEEAVDHIKERIIDQYCYIMNDEIQIGEDGKLVTVLGGAKKKNNDSSSMPLGNINRMEADAATAARRDKLKQEAKVQEQKIIDMKKKEAEKKEKEKQKIANQSKKEKRRM